MAFPLMFSIQIFLSFLTISKTKKLTEFSNQFEYNPVNPIQPLMPLPSSISLKCYMVCRSAASTTKKEDCEKLFLLLHLASDLFKMNGLKRLLSLYKATSSIRTGRKRILDPSPLSSRLWRKMGSQPKEKQLSHPSVCAGNLWLVAQRICTQMSIKKKKEIREQYTQIGFSCETVWHLQLSHNTTRYKKRWNIRIGSDTRPVLEKRQCIRVFAFSCTSYEYKCCSL